MADSEVGARAYPIEAEEALNAWMSRREASGVWTSSAGWWYAAWMHRQAEVERLQAQRAAQAELIRELRSALEWALAEGGWRLWYYAAEPLPAILTRPPVGEPATFTDAFLARLDASAQEARQQAAEGRIFEFCCERCKRLLVSVVVESRSPLVKGESQLHGLLLCEDCRNGWVAREVENARQRGQAERAQ